MNIIFDIGNVLCEWNPQRLIADVFSDPSEQKDALRSIIGHSDWVELDKGAITLDQAIANAASRCTLQPDKIEAVYDRTPASLTMIQPMVEVVHDLHGRGFPLYVLSNMQQHSWDHLSTTYGIWSLFRGIVVSCEINLAKPDSRIFHHIATQHDLKPAETLFIDDMLDNVQAARNYGFDAIHADTTSNGIDQLYQAIASRPL